MSQATRVGRERWAPAAILALALLLRLYHLTAVDLRGDEAFDLRYAAQPIAEIIRNNLCCQAYPPLHHVGLHLWQHLSGDGTWGYRMLLGVLPGLATVWLTYRLGGELGGEGAGRAAGLLAAVSPYLVWWSQDGHFYSGLMAFGAGITWLGLQAMRRGSRRTLVPYVGLSAVGLHYHYFLALPVLGMALAMAVSAARERSADQARRLLLAHLAMMALVAPWALAVAGMMSRFELGWAQASTLPQFAAHLARVYLVGYGVPPVAAWLTVPAGLALMALGLRRAPHWAGRWAGLMALSLGPLLTFWLASQWRPMFDDKFTASAVPTLLALAGCGVAAPSRRRAIAGGLTLLVLMGSAAGLARHYWDPATYKSPAWAQAVAHVRDHAGPGALLLYNYPDPALAYYAAKAGVPAQLLPADTAESLIETEAALRRLTDGEAELWLVPLTRPEWPGGAAVESALAQHAELRSQASFHGLTVRQYLPQGAGGWLEADAAWGDWLRLKGYRLYRAEDGSLSVTLRWATWAPAPHPYTIFVHLVGPDGAMLVQHDSQPVAGTHPFDAWLPGEVALDQHLLPAPEGALPADERLLVGLYRPEDMERAECSGAECLGDYAELPLVPEQAH